MALYFSLAQELAPQLIAWRRDLHQHPELGFQEHRTAELVARHLEGLGIRVTRGVGKTGVVGVIEGAGPGPVVLLRFDMDALPIEEKTGLPFASQHPGLMHACGHDGHTAIGMGVAEMLARTRENWPGTVKLLFQPAEEGAGGAKATIRDGVLENPRPDAAFALHLWNQFPLGKVVAQAGPLMAAADRFELTIRGKGGHGAAPEEAIDAVVVGAEVVNALHHIVSRNIPPHKTAVLTVGSFHAGNAFNVIAEQAMMEGTLRTFESEVRAVLIRRMEEVLAGITAAHGAEFAFEVREDVFVPAVINDAQMTAIARAAIQEEHLDVEIMPITPIMVSEDMSEILNRVPGCFLLLGAAPKGGARGPHHNPRFDINEAALPQGATLLAATAVKFLQTSITAKADDALHYHTQST